MSIPVIPHSGKTFLAAERREPDEAEQGLAKDWRKSRHLDYLVGVLAGLGGVLLILAVPVSVGMVVGWTTVSIASAFSGYTLIYGCLAGGLHIVLGVLSLRAAMQARVGRLDRGVGLMTTAVLAVPAGIFLLGGLFDIAAAACLLAAGVVADFA